MTDPKRLSVSSLKEKLFLVFSEETGVFFLALFFFNICIYYSYWQSSSLGILLKAFLKKLL